MGGPSITGSPIRAIAITIVFFVLTLLFVSQPPAAFAAPKDHALTFRLKWIFNTSVVGDLYAERQGYFSARGLAVTIKAGGPERNAITELELGYADFGVASADQVIRALAKGSPVVVIAQLFQKNPLQWIYRSDRVVLNRLSDLKGKTIGVTFGGNDETIMRALLAEAGLTDRDVHLFSVRYDYTPFFKKEVNIWPVYRNAQGIILARKLRKAGEAVGFFDPTRFGVKFVANSVVTSRKMVAEHPEIVKKFLAALMEGWRQSMRPENQKTAIAVLRHYDKDTSRKMMVAQLAATRKIVVPEDGGAIGTIDVDGWQQTEHIMRTQGLIKKAVDIDKALISDFLPGSRHAEKPHNP